MVHLDGIQDLGAVHSVENDRWIRVAGRTEGRFGHIYRCREKPATPWWRVNLDATTAILRCVPSSPQQPQRHLSHLTRSPSLSLCEQGPHVVVVKHDTFFGSGEVRRKTGNPQLVFGCDLGWQRAHKEVFKSRVRCRWGPATHHDFCFRHDTFPRGPRPKYTQTE